MTAAALSSRTHLTLKLTLSCTNSPYRPKVMLRSLLETMRRRSSSSQRQLSLIPATMCCTATGAQLRCEHCAAAWQSSKPTRHKRVTYQPEPNLQEPSRGCHVMLCAARQYRQCTVAVLIHRDNHTQCIRCRYAYAATVTSAIAAGVL
jgi:hypothetical protein